MCADPGDFSIVCQLLVENGFADELNDGLWTVFAPTNSAFDNAPRFGGDLDVEEILLGHVVANASLASDDLECTEKIEMANGMLTRTVCKSGRTYQKGSGNSDDLRPELVETDIEACNGVVHVVNQLILT